MHIPIGQQQLLLGGQQLEDVEGVGLVLGEVETAPLTMIKRGWLETVLMGDGGALKVAPEAVRGGKEMVLAAVSANGLELEFAAPTLQADRQVVMTAVQETGRALKFASAELREDFEIVSAAVSNWGFALKYTSDRLRHQPYLFDVALATYIHHQRKKRG